MGAELSLDGAVLLAWAVMMLAAAAARLRFEGMRGGTHDLGRALENPELRRGVVTVLELRFPGFEELLAADPLEAGKAQLMVLADLERLAEDYRAELEPPEPGGLGMTLGRFRSNPDHRAAALELAGAIQDSTRATLAAIDRPPLALGLATDDAVALPYPVPTGLGAVTLGRVRERAKALAVAAEPGEVLVDEGRPEVDQDFVFEETARGRRLVLGELESSEVGELERSALGQED